MPNKASAPTLPARMKRGAPRTDSVPPVPEPGGHPLRVQMLHGCPFVEVGCHQSGLQSLGADRIDIGLLGIPDVMPAFHDRASLSGTSRPAAGPGTAARRR
jgi:hypothetical protein